MTRSLGKETCRGMNTPSLSAEHNTFPRAV